MAEAGYLDLSYIVWRAAVESAGSGWGLVVSPMGPPPSGYIPESYTARGSSLTGLFQALGNQGRANGVRTTNSPEGHVLVEVGSPAWQQYEGVLVDPLNVREESASTSGRELHSVTAEGDGESGTANDAGARFPGRQVVTSSGSGSAKYLADATLNTASRATNTVTLRCKRNLGTIRVGDIATYVRAGIGAVSYLRVSNIVVDESALPTEFRLTGQVIEPDAAIPVALTKGAFWPGTRGTGNAVARQIRRLDSR